jgi:hypothetical protein
MPLTNARTLIESSRSNFNLRGRSFPRDIEKVPHKLVMRFQSRRATQGGRSQNAPAELTRTNSYIVLPVPSQIVDGVAVNYKNVDLGISGEIIAEVPQAAANILNGSLSQSSFQSLNVRGGQVISGALGAFAQNAAATLANNILGRMGASRTAREGLAVGFNRTLNPFTTAVFNGVELREFVFNWTLSPKDPIDSAGLELIIIELRRRSLPRLPAANLGLFMEFPDVVEFALLGAINEFYTFPTSPCVINSVTFNRTPTGSPVFFAGTGAPAVVEITMKLTEIKPLIQTDTTTEQNIYGVDLNGFTAPPPVVPAR